MVNFLEYGNNSYIIIKTNIFKYNITNFEILFNSIFYNYIILLLKFSTFFLNYKILIVIISFFSIRDQMFTLLASGSHHTWSWDFDKHKHNPKVSEVDFSKPSQNGSWPYWFILQHQTLVRVISWHNIPG